MQRVNTYQLYQLSLAIAPLKNLQTNQTIDDVAWELHTARIWLQWFLDGKVLPLRVSRVAVQRLLATIANLIPPNYPASLPAHPEEQLQFHAGAFTVQSRDFETVLAAELQVIDTYVIDKKGIYVTSDLIDAADIALDEAVRKTVPAEALRDFKESGRCLAFDLATASGYHAMRAVETIVKQWHRAVCKPPAGKKMEMGSCINELRGANADKGILGILDQIRDLHRNPLMHPEIFLTLPEALRLFNIVQSAISAMAEEVAKIPPATLPASTTP